MIPDPARAEEPSGLDQPSRPTQDWRVLVAVFWVTSMVEGLGVSQIFALFPTYLREMGVAEGDRLAFVGLFSALIFVVGMPLVPLWGVWADKYSRKAVIIRSALVEAVVFAGVALSREPWQLALSMLLIGFQLGNTGVMLAGIRDVTPRRRLGTVMGIFGASGRDRDGRSARHSPGSSSTASAGRCRPSSGCRPRCRSGPPCSSPSGRARSGPRSCRRVGSSRWRSGRCAASSPIRTVRRIFVIFGVSFLATQMSRPYLPVVVEGLVGTGPGLASAIALVMGTAALVGGLVAPLGGVVGDRIGFRSVLVAALAGGGVVLALMPFVPGVAPLALLAVVFATATATVSAMVFGLLATRCRPNAARRR